MLSKLLLLWLNDGRDNVNDDLIICIGEEFGERVGLVVNVMMIGYYYKGYYLRDDEDMLDESMMYIVFDFFGFGMFG